MDLSPITNISMRMVMWPIQPSLSVA